MAKPYLKSGTWYARVKDEAGRWGAGLIASKMIECRWLKPKLVGQFEFVEWTPENHLRHVRFIALSGQRNARDVQRDS